MRYTIEFELPDNDTVLSEIGSTYVEWAVWGYSGHAIPKPVKKRESLKKKARWIKLDGMAPPEHHGHKICSVCECMAPYDPLHVGREILSPYCPGCGAKMEVRNAAD